MGPLHTQDTGDHREKKGLETFLSFERYRGIVDAQRIGLGEEEHALAVSEQVRNMKEKMVGRISAARNVTSVHQLRHGEQFSLM